MVSCLVPSSPPAELSSQEGFKPQSNKQKRTQRVDHHREQDVLWRLGNDSVYVYKADLLPSPGSQGPTEVRVYANPHPAPTIWSLHLPLHPSLQIICCVTTCHPPGWREERGGSGVGHDSELVPPPSHSKALREALPWCLLLSLVN